MDSVRLIIITVPPADVQAKVAELRGICSGVSASYAAAAYPPHVTLRTGVVVPETALGAFLDEFGLLLQGARSFGIRTGDIVSGTVAGDGGEVPIVALQIEPSAELLALNARLLRHEPYRASGRTRFWPHLTLAFQDLSPEGLRNLERHLADREELRSLRFAWTCDNVSLYRQRGRRWLPHHIYKLA